MISSGPDKSIGFIKVTLSFRDQIRMFFEHYTSIYRNENDIVYTKHIELKQTHILRVCNEISNLGVAMGMNAEEIAFTEVIALLHDIGRFEQFDRFRTFSDIESENHALIALNVIKKENLFDGLDKSNTELISQVIVNHNLPAVPENETPLVDFYSRLLRDADKLDIWRITLETNIFNKIKTETFPDIYEVPDSIYTRFEQHRIITLDIVDSFYDSILFRLSWIFDLNFIPTLKIADERKIFRKLLAKLPVSERLDKISAWIDDYIQLNLQGETKFKHHRRLA